MTLDIPNGTMLYHSAGDPQVLGVNLLLENI